MAAIDHFKQPNLYKTKVYLACPYSHATCKSWETVRFELANLAAMTLINAGYIVFSPISHSHPISGTQPENRNSYALWLGQDIYFMEWANILIVLMLPGWGDSKGVQWEIEWFEKYHKPCHYLGLSEIYEAQKEQSHVVIANGQERIGDRDRADSSLQRQGYPTFVPVW